MKLKVPLLLCSILALMEGLLSNENACNSCIKVFVTRIKLKFLPVVGALDHFYGWFETFF